MNSAIGTGRRLAAGLLIFGGLTACERELDPETLRELITARTLGLAHLEEFQLPEAEAAFRRVIDLAPDEPLGHANLGLVSVLMGRHDDAEEQLTRALAIAPDHSDARLILAKSHELRGQLPEARAQLETALEHTPDHVKTLFALAELAATSADTTFRDRRREYLTRIIELVPANLHVRFELIDVLLRDGDAEQAAAHMEEVRRQVPEFPEDAEFFFATALEAMRASRPDDALQPTIIFRRFLESTANYQDGVFRLLWSARAPIGVFTFSDDMFRQPAFESVAREAIGFTDVTAAAGLDIPGAVAGVTIADYDGDGDTDLYVSGPTPSLFANDGGRYTDVTAAAGLTQGHATRSATFADYDNDGRLDLYVTLDGANLLYRNMGDGTFDDVTAAAGVQGAASSRAAVFFDADTDGDLDLFVANAGPNRLYRNNLDGSFLERGETAGVDGITSSRDVVFGDVDGDFDLDLVVANDDPGNQLYANLRGGRFQDVTEGSGLTASAPSGAVAAGDYDNDGSLDLFVAAPSGGTHRLFRNGGDGTFEHDARAGQALAAAQGLGGSDATFLDYDNDGWLDLLVGTETAGDGVRGVFLFRNTGDGFQDASAALPADLQPGAHLGVADYDDDGDVDLFIASPDGVRLLRNDGGNVNHYLELQLRGLARGSGKNNHFGIGATIEVRTGDRYQARTVTSPTTHLGLGDRARADAIRIIWPNGVPQNVFAPLSDQVLVERQILKGSCAFLYAWNGSEYEFVTDVMWRSALGMPMGIMGARASYAPPQASQEYLRIPGDRLVARDGVYSIQLTEELWETAYVDAVTLLVVDYPDSVDIYVDERFVPPAPPSLNIYQVAETRYPVSATDGRGHDLLPLLRAPDHVYVSDLTPDRYQGITEMHDLVLDLGDLAGADDITLFMRGWIFPTDASINVAMAQSDAISAVAPYLQVPDSAGRWHTVIDDLSFPAGKHKVVVTDLTGKFPTDDYRVRIRTNMEIYWDHAFFSTDAPHAPLRQTPLPPTAADLHYRGYSREYRKGGRFGPHWFDYADVSTAPRWLPLRGRFTRFGDVLPLLLDSDDRYIIMAPGDEATLEFDAGDAPPLQPGWARDFLLYSDGWIKDADMNTAYGDVVTPLPFHNMSRYPYGAGEAYPSDDASRRFIRTYNTRRVPRERR